MTEAMPFLQKYDITFLRPPTIRAGQFFVTGIAPCRGEALAARTNRRQNG